MIASAPALAGPKVVVSILPLHSLTAGVMQGIDDPQLLVPVGASPHT
jgi:zinc transport system substrate-binding protein